MVTSTTSTTSTSASDAGSRLSVERARMAVEAAIDAPSIHNTQPWRWTLRGDTLALSADLDRAVPVADPDHRQLVVSCGAALFNAWLSLRAAGLEVQVDELPAGSDLTTGPLAVLRVIGVCPPAQGETTLADAISRRHTDRRPFDTAGLPDELVRGLRQAAQTEGCWLESVQHTGTRVELSMLLARADWIESHDPDYRAELRAWSRTDPNAPDGVPRSAVVGSDQPRQSEFPLRDFDMLGDAGHPLHDTQVERPGVLVLGTDGDNTADWLHAGRALGRVLLVATAAGLAASPLGQAIDIEATRLLIREATGGVGEVQMILRVGYPDPACAALPQTPRRAACDVLHRQSD